MEIEGRTRPFSLGIEFDLDETEGEGRMLGRVSKYRIRLNRKPRRRLEALVRRRSPEHWKVARARIVLLSADGNGIAQIAAALSQDPQVVRRWLKRYGEQGFDGLCDRPRTGRPVEIEPHVWQKLATLVVQSPSKFDVPASTLVGACAARFRRSSSWLADQSIIGESFSSIDGPQATPGPVLAQPYRSGFR